MIARRHFGFALIVAGVGMLVLAGGRYALGAVRADRARQAWDEAVARNAVARARTSVDRESRDVVAGAPLARLVIPRIGLDEIVLEGVGDDQLNVSPGHVPGSAVPGDSGNAVISAHRDRHFKAFDLLAVGDTIQTESFTRADTWVIVSRKVIDKDAPALFTTRDQTLTLTTCWPIRYLGNAPERLILTAKLATEVTH